MVKIFMTGCIWNEGEPEAFVKYYKTTGKRVPREWLQKFHFMSEGNDIPEMTPYWPKEDE